MTLFGRLTFLVMLAILGAVRASPLSPRQTERGLECFGRDTNNNPGADAADISDDIYTTCLLFDFQPGENIIPFGQPRVNSYPTINDKANIIFTVEYCGKGSHVEVVGDCENNFNHLLDSCGQGQQVKYGGRYEVGDMKYTIDVQPSSLHTLSARQIQANDLTCYAANQYSATADEVNNAIDAWCAQNDIITGKVMSAGETATNISYTSSGVAIGLLIGNSGTNMIWLNGDYCRENFRVLIDSCEVGNPVKYGGEYFPSPHTVMWNVDIMQGHAAEKYTRELAKQVTGDDSLSLSDTKSARQIAANELSCYPQGSVEATYDQIVAAINEFCSKWDHIPHFLILRNGGTELARYYPSPGVMIGLLIGNSGPGIGFYSGATCKSKLEVLINSCYPGATNKFGGEYYPAPFKTMWIVTVEVPSSNGDDLLDKFNKAVAEHH